MKRILVVAGTRPEFIKIAPLLKEFDKYKDDFIISVLDTGQHTSLTKDITSTVKLDMLYKSKNRLNDITINILSNHLNPEDYDYVLVQGDTTSAFSMALWAYNNKIKIIHLEAGLRTYAKNPWPEEFNRRTISLMSDINFCPTITNSKNLFKEYINKYYTVGNTSIDNLKELNYTIAYDNIVLVTLHRRENIQFIKEWFNAIEELALENKDLEFIFPMHPNPEIQKHRDIFKQVKVIEPIEYEKCIEYISKAKFIITDSGGIQEEASFYKKKVLICRDSTEREIIIKASFLCKYTNLKSIFNSCLKNKYEYDIECPYDIKNIFPTNSKTTSEEICKILKNM